MDDRKVIHRYSIHKSIRYVRAGMMMEGREMNNSMTGYPSIDKPWIKWYDDEIVLSELPRETLYNYLY